MDGFDENYYTIPKNNISRLKFSIALYGQYFLKIFQKNLKIDRILDTKIVFFADFTNCERPSK